MLFLMPVCCISAIAIATYPADTPALLQSSPDPTVLNFCPPATLPAWVLLQ